MFITSGVTMPPLENIDKDSSPTFPLAAYVVKLKFRLKNTSSWSVTSMTLLHACYDLEE